VATRGSTTAMHPSGASSAVNMERRATAVMVPLAANTRYVRGSF
jgi:hypothetical protein